MPLRVSAFIAVPSVGLVACAPQDRAERLHDGAVYAAVIDSLFSRQSLGKSGVVVEDQLTSLLVDRVAQEFVGDINSLAEGDRAFAKHFWDRAVAAGTIRPVFADVQANSAATIALADSASLAEMYALAERDQQTDPQKYITPTSAYWKRFHREFAPAKTLVGFTSVGYNLDYTRALVYVTFGCDGMCGGSYTVSLERSGPAWRVLRVIVGFVA